MMKIRGRHICFLFGIPMLTLIMSTVMFVSVFAADGSTTISDQVSRLKDRLEYAYGVRCIEPTCEMDYFLLPLLVSETIRKRRKET